jgi:hypothetical protein
MQCRGHGSVPLFEKAMIILFFENLRAFYYSTSKVTGIETMLWVQGATNGAPI